jgi:hypothetical protein
MMAPGQSLALNLPKKIEQRETRRKNAYGDFYDGTRRAAYLRGCHSSDDAGSLLGQILLFCAPAVFLAWQVTHRIRERLRSN